MLADKGYTGAGDHIRTSCKGKNRFASQKAANRAHAELRGPGERPAQTRRILHKLRCRPWKADQLAQGHPPAPVQRDRTMKKAHWTPPPDHERTSDRR